MTFEYELPAQKEFDERIEKICQKYPYIVAEENGKVIGYAYAHEFKERIAYQWGAELSVYLDKKATSKGIGAKLYNVLTKILELQGINTVYAIITQENETSAKMHEKYGFKHVATIKNVGFKTENG
ncbi:MAG: GNAT family N-acetyltransferase [Candidatus Gastranaerophilaceae bacterium]